MPIVKKQMLRIIHLTGLLRTNCYPNCSTIAGLMRKLDIEENLNVACSAQTIYRDIQTLKNDFNAPIEFDPRRNGYFLTDPDWKFPGISFEVPEISADCLAGTIFENVVVSCDAVLTRYIRRYSLHCQQHLEMLTSSASVLPSAKKRCLNIGNWLKKLAELILEKRILDDGEIKTFFQQS